MGQVQITLSEPIPDLQCSNCGEGYRYDPLMGWGCLVLLNQKNIPNTILGAWCDEFCLLQWLDTPEEKRHIK